MMTLTSTIFARATTSQNSNRTQVRRLLRTTSLIYYCITVVRAPFAHCSPVNRVGLFADPNIHHSSKLLEKFAFIMDPQQTEAQQITDLISLAHPG